ncbi:hypothetical protein D3C78_1635330 [compost metagenome]
MAERSALVVSWGLSLLSMPMISYLTPAAFFLLNSSARNWKLLSWLEPSAAIIPDNGSSQAILTVSPCCANAAPALTRITDAATALIANFIVCLLFGGLAGGA